MTLLVLRHNVPTIQMCLSTLLSRTQRWLSTTSKGSRDFLWPREQADRPTGEADVLPFVGPNAYMRPRRDLIPHAHHCVVCAGGAPLSFRYPSKTGVLVDSLGMALVPLTCMSLVVLPPSEPVSMCR